MLQLPSGLQQKRKREDTSRESFGDSAPDSRFQGPLSPLIPGMACRTMFLQRRIWKLRATRPLSS